MRVVCARCSVGGCVMVSVVGCQSDRCVPAGCMGGLSIKAHSMPC